MFEPLPARFDFPAAEKKTLEFWEAHDVFAASMRRRAGAARFVFYEGPPTANGLPHPGHALTRAMKDLFPRYQTMRGRLVERKGGWDTHGLPVEREVCKELGLKTKQDIEAYGVEKFNLKCIQSVFRYTREWEELTRRLGYWVDLKEAYVTYHQSYVESVWWSLKTLFERGVLYQGHKVVWWWAQGGTALSSGEVGEGYKTVDDPSVFVKFPLTDARGAAGGAGILPAGGQDAHPTPRVSLLVWTTTPWTLISNHFAAVHPELEYALVHDPVDDEYLYIAAGLVEAIAKKVKRELRVAETCKGTSLVGRRYRPPFAELYYALLGAKSARLRTEGQSSIGWRVTAADFVTTDSGSGIVHEAPAFGEVDFNLLQEERKRFAEFDAIPLLCAVAADGTFNTEAPERYRGRWVKDCDKEIVRELRDERKTPWGTSLLYHQEQYRHDYPFCPQSPDDPLIQYARKSWFVRTSQFKDEFLKNNAAINWLPEHIKEGRFGDFLRNNVDWALSRERYWGTPLPIWQCEACGRMEAIGSFAELQAKPGATDGGYWERKVAEHQGEEFPDHLRVHKPYVDEWVYACAACAADNGAAEQRSNIGDAHGPRMRRVPEVIDCWWDAGSMPFAQWGFPHTDGSIEKFSQRFPADFISEAIDQTRGWFYGLLAISTLLSREGAFSGAGTTGDAVAPRAVYPLPYRTCIVLGHMMGEDGNKMSKKLRNYKEPTYIFDTFGADAMRWYFFSAQTPWTSVRFQEAAIRDSQREFLVKLYNVLSFFTIYASIDGFDPRRRDEPGNPMGYRPAAQRTELDRWIISELYNTVAAVRASMDRFENYPAAQRLNDFVDALSNWYVRRSRDRFWKPVQAGKRRSDEATKRRSDAATERLRGDAAAAESTGVAAVDQDKWDAYHTLYGCVRVFSRLIAPFTPFFAETMHQTLRVPDDPPSVHLCDYPTPDEIGYHDDALSAEMDMVREIASLGRAARATAAVKEARKVRQPLARVEIVLARHEHEDWLQRHADLIAEEVNVKSVEFTAEADQYVTYKVVPNFKSIGEKYRALVPKIKAALAALTDAAAARRALLTSGALPLTIDGQTVQLTPEEVEIRLEARPGWAAAPGRVGVVVLSTELTPALRDEGLVREFIHYVQAERKEQNLSYEARIRLHVDGPPALLDVLRRFESVVAGECLVSGCAYGDEASRSGAVISVEGHEARLRVVRADS